MDPTKQQQNNTVKNIIEHKQIFKKYKKYK